MTLLTFVIKFLPYPSSINVTEADSNACGRPNTLTIIWCYGKDSATTMFEAWKQYLNSASQSLLELGIPESSLDKISSCNATNIYALDMATSPSTFPPGSPYEGQVFDNPWQPGYLGVSGSANIILPKKWILENLDIMMSFDKWYKQVGLPSLVDDLYMVFGGRSSEATIDQANSLSEAHREGGFMLFPPLEFFLSLSFYSHLIPKMYDRSSGSFPGFIGSNHAGPNTHGSLKSDLTKDCPMEWTLEERADKCE